jgi:cytochrome P450 family 110
MTHSATNLPPGPRTPAVFQLFQWMTRLPSFLETCANRYGDTFTLRLPVFGTYVVFSAPEDLREIFEARTENFDDGGRYSFFTQSLGPKSLLALAGDEHRSERNLLGPRFHN